MTILLAMLRLQFTMMIVETEFLRPLFLFLQISFFYSFACEYDYLYRVRLIIIVNDWTTLYVINHAFLQKLHLFTLISFRVHI